MSTELKSKNKEFSLTRYWGGEKRGSCIQITTKNGRKGEPTPSENAMTSLGYQHINLSRDEAAKLATDLAKFALRLEEELIDEEV